MSAVAAFLIDLFPLPEQSVPRLNGPYIAIVDAFGVTIARSEILPKPVQDCRIGPAIT